MHDVVIQDIYRSEAAHTYVHVCNEAARAFAHPYVHVCNA